MRRVTPAIVAAAGAAVVALFGSPATLRAAGTFTVTSTQDAGPGTLRQAIADVNAASGGTINVTTGGLVVLASPLPMIAAPLTLNGNNLLVSGNNQYRVLFIDAPAAAVVNLNNLAILNGRAKGGDGGNNHGGGGGLGAGGGLFVSAGNVTLSNITFSNNSAVGGRGGNATLSPGGSGTFAQGGGGGGGLGGTGGFVFGGGGGYLGNGGGGSDSGPAGGGGGGILTSGGGSSGNTGGAGGGAGGTGPAFGGGLPTGSGGGGGGGPSSTGANGVGTSGGNGGRFGGGGGAGQIIGSAAGGNGNDYGGGGGAYAQGGNGGFGGGGGGANTTAGSGGFGGGGGGSYSGTPGTAGAFAGAGSSSSISDVGGGGAALGAQVFVRPGAALALIDPSADAGTLTAGSSGGTPFSTTGGFGNPGLIAGSGFFLAGPTTVTLSAGQFRTIAGAIDDVGNFFNQPTATGFAYATLTKTGAGTLTLSGASGYRGGTVISQGTLIAGSATAPGSSITSVTLNDANTGSANPTLLVAPGITFANFVEVSDSGTGTPTIGSAPGSSAAAIFTSVHLTRSATILAQNTTPLNATNDAGQTRFDGPLTGAGGVTITGGNMVQYRSGGKGYLGTTIVTGNSTLSLYGGVSIPNSIVQIDAGSTLVLDGATTGSIRGLAGAGTLRNNDAWGTSTLNVGGGTSAAVVNTFTGPIVGALALKLGADTQEIGAQDNVAVGLTVALGQVRLLGDARVGNVAISTADAGAQSLDLAGHVLRVAIGGLGGLNLETQMNIWAGAGLAGGDGVIDSTAAGHPGSRIGIAFTTSSGQPLTVRLTVAGDANLDGVAGFSDLVTLAQNYDGSGPWDTGDFTYDGKVDFADLVLLAQNYDATFAAQAVMGASPAANFDRDLAAAFAAVPEPAAWTWLTAATVTSLARRRLRAPR